MACTGSAWPAQTLRPRPKWQVEPPLRSRLQTGCLYGSLLLAVARSVREMLPLLVFTGLYVFVVYAGELIWHGYLPIYMHDDRPSPTAVSGAVIGIQPLVELILERRWPWSLPAVSA